MNRQPIPNLTDKQALELHRRDDLPDDIRSQVVGQLSAMQKRLYVMEVENEE